MTTPVRTSGPTAVQTLKLGTRASQLARTQSSMVADSLAAQGFSVDLVEVTTQGDVDPRSLVQIGGTGVFAAALRRALLAGQVDLAVHSLKDLPVEQPAGLQLAAIPRREDPRDVLVGARLADLAPGARVGTGSPRRATQLAAIRPDLAVVEVRGNVDTRIGFVRDGRLDAVILARAGLARLGRLADIAETFDTDVMLPAPGQGALAIETASSDLAAALADALDDPATRLEVTAERAVLAGLQAGCSAPVGAWARFDGGTLALTASVGPLRSAATTTETGPAAATALGHDVAADLLSQGAATLMGTTQTGQH